MTTKGRLFSAAVIALILGGTTACGTQEYLTQDPTVLLTYQLSPNTENLENLSKALYAQINNNRKAGMQQPGLFCEYAVTLAKLGRMEEANQWFNNEVSTFPSTAEYVKQIRTQLSVEYAAEVAAKEESRWQQNDIIVDNPDDIEQMRQNKPREAAQLPNLDESSNGKQTLDEDTEKPVKGKSHKKKSSKKSKKGKK